MRTLSWSNSGKLNVVRISRSRPIAPCSTSERAAAACGWWRHMNASITITPARSAASQASSASAACREYGFSTSTCLPASIAFSVHSWCIPFGSEM